MFNNSCPTCVSSRKVLVMCGNQTLFKEKWVISSGKAELSDSTSFSSLLLPVVFKACADVTWHGASDQHREWLTDVLRFTFSLKDAETLCLKSEHIVRSVYRESKRSTSQALGNPHGTLFLAAALSFTLPSHWHTHTCRKSSEVTADPVPLKGDDSQEKNESWSGGAEWKQLLCKQRKHTHTDKTCGNIRTHGHTQTAKSSLEFSSCSSSSSCSIPPPLT